MGRAAELMDLPDLAPADDRRALAELDRATRWLLGGGPVVRTLLPHLRPPRAASRRALLVDVGTGSGFTSRLLARAARRAGVELVVVGVDRKLAHLVAGREQGIAQLRVVADAACLPLGARAVDWSLSTLFFHHFDAAENLGILAEMRRVARAGVAVVDLRRSRMSALLVRLLLPLLGAGPVTRHDGRVSVAQAWSLDEVARLASGLPVRELRPRFPFRFSLVLAADP